MLSLKVGGLCRVNTMFLGFAPKRTRGKCDYKPDAESPAFLICSYFDSAIFRETVHPPAGYARRLSIRVHISRLCLSNLCSARGVLGGLINLGDDLFQRDRKSTRLNSSHVRISYAVFCLKKK